MVDIMSKTEVEEFLEETGTGVLSLSSQDESYAIPESFGFQDGALYFQLVWDEGSEKMSYIESTKTATLTVFSEEPAQSVIVRGTIEVVPSDEHPVAATAVAENANIPTLNVIPDKVPAELSMGFYRLEPDEMAGRIFTHGRSTVSE